MIVRLRAALYLRVLMARQAEHDVSIPDQKRQGEGPDHGDRAYPSRQVRRGHDHSHRQGRALSLLCLLDESAAGTDRLRGYGRADGEAGALDRREEYAERRREHIAEFNKRAAESALRLKRLYDAIEAGVAVLDDPAMKDRIAGFKAIRDQAKADAERALAMRQNSGQKAITPQMLRKFAVTARDCIRLDGGSYCRDHLRALAQRVELAESEVRIMGSKPRQLRTLMMGVSVNPVPTQGLRWRTRRDSNPRPLPSEGSTLSS